jgi:hypothetical protein
MVFCPKDPLGGIILENSLALVIRSNQPQLFAQGKE